MEGIEMPRLATPLTAAKVRTARPGRFHDGDGLVLLVRKAAQPGAPERAFWLFRYSSGGRVREAGLGRARGPNAVTLAEARERVRRMRDKLRDGKDPIDAKEAEKAAAKADAAKAAAGAITFAQVADLFIAAHEAGWRNPKHRQQWRNTLRDYVLPIVGELPVAAVDTGAVVRIIEPLWGEKTETASRVRGRIEAVLDYAAARGWRDRDTLNPATWRGHLDKLLPKRSKVRRVKHHDALPWRECSAFVERLRLRQHRSIADRALEFTILTACRSGEARGARWREIDLGHAVWTIPAERMKAGREHRVPLSDAALSVLREMAAPGSEPDALVFPGGRVGRPLTDVRLAEAVVAAGGGGATTHGFRSTFADWCAETGKPADIREAALAHTLGNRVAEAYQRGDLLARRAALMQQWADFCGSPMVCGDVVPFVRAAAAG